MALRCTLRQLEYLVAVGESGSITGAAQRLNVSPPSVSTAISQLEAAFGLQLFVRKHARGLSLTQGGRQFMDQAQNVLRGAAMLGNLANTITGQVGGPLHVGCLLTFAQIVLPKLRRSFETANPGVAFHQSEQHQAQLIDGLRAARLDVALTYDLDIPADLEFLPLVSLPPYAIFAADHPLAGRARITPAELAPLPLVLLDLPLSVDYFHAIFAADNLRPNIAERTQDMAVMRSLVANKFGYSIANIRPQSDVAPDGGLLASVPIFGSYRPLRMGLVMAEGAENLQNIRSFIAHCRCHLRATTPEFEEP